jgi:hypothetical protein
MYDEIQEYYGQTLHHDLQTNACYDQVPPEWLKPVLSTIHNEVLSRYYGYGQSLPFAAQTGQTASGSGGCC